MYSIKDRQNPKRFMLRRVAWILLIIGAAGFLSGFAAVRFKSLPAWPRPQAPGTSQSTVSSVKPTNRSIASYQVAPTLPKYISIPAIGVDKARIIQLGVYKNQIAAPDNIYDAGWFAQSAKPGQSGVMFIFGHVSSWTARGIFYNLKKLKPGQSITIVRGDGKLFNYTVRSLKTYPADSVNMSAVLSPVDRNRPGLNLMTCTGQIIHGSSDFSQRLVVFASLSAS